MERRENGAGALAGLRVLDLTDASGRLAGKLLAEAGADVLRLRRGSSGAPMKGAAAHSGGLLDWWFDLGTRHAPLDLDDADDRRRFLDLGRRADVLIETEPPGRLQRLQVDFDALRAANPRLVQVSLTPFGRRGPRVHWQVSDLVISALGGVLAVTGTPDQPLNGYGRQSFNVGGFYAAICALAGVYAARESGSGEHFDLSLQQSVISCTEQVLMYWFFRDNVFHASGGIAARRESLHWSGLYEVLPCRDGHIMLTPAPSAPTLMHWLGEDGMLGSLADSPPVTAIDLFLRSKEVMSVLRAWAATKSASQLFAEGQRRHLPFGEVMSVPAAARIPQHAARGFFGAVAGGDGVRVPGPLCRLSDTPSPLPTPPAEPISADAALASWPERQTEAAPSTGLGKPLAGLRVLDFTWVLAGPMATRILGDLGADIVKLQTEERSQGAGHNDYPFFLMWNRSKRSVTLDMKRDAAKAVIRRLLEQADIVIDNFSAGVLDRWGIGFAQAREWNPRIIYVSLAGCGSGGPWRDFVTYAPTIHALSGLTDLTNPPGRHDIGFGFSLSDHVVGLAAAVGILAALEARRRTGRGQSIDISQLEAGTYLLGPAFSDYLNNGRTAEPAGNRDAFEDPVPNEAYRCADGEWLAITARTDGEWRTLCETIGDRDLAEAKLSGIAARREQRARIDERIATWAARQSSDGAMRFLQQHGVPAGVVQNARMLAEADEQLASRSWLVELEHGSHGRQTIDRFPAALALRELEPYAASPILGQHNFEVYGELAGMTEEEIAAAIGDGLFS